MDYSKLLFVGFFGGLILFITLLVLMPSDPVPYNEDIRVKEVNCDDLIGCRCLVDDCNGQEVWLACPAGTRKDAYILFVQ